MRKMWLSGALAVFGLGIIVFTFVVRQNQLDALDEATILAANTVGEIAVGENLALETTIPADAAVLSGEIVVGVRENYISGRHRHWKLGTEYRQAIDLSTVDGATVSAEFADVIPSGKHHIEELSPDLRTRGYARGAELLLLGTVTSLSPLKMRVDTHFGGNVSDYRAHLENRGVYYVGSGIFGASLLLLVMFRRRETALTA